MGGKMGDVRPDEQQFKEFKERVYTQSKKKILDEIAEFKNGTNAEYNEKVLQLKRNHDYTLRVNGRFHDLELKCVEEEFNQTVLRVEQETKEKLEQIEKRMRSELDNYKSELQVDHEEKGSAKSSIIRDLDTSSKTLRSHADKRRKKLFDETGDSKAKSKKRPRTKTTKDLQPLRLSKQSESLQTWDVDGDIRTMNKITTSSRGRRPPAKLATGTR